MEQAETGCYEASSDQGASIFEKNMNDCMPSKNSEEWDQSEKNTGHVSEQSGALENSVIDSVLRPNSSKSTVKNSFSMYPKTTDHAELELKPESLCSAHSSEQDGLETACNQNSDCINQDPDLSRGTYPDQLSYKMNVDDPSSEAAEVLASLPSLIPASDPPIRDFYKPKVQESCTNSCHQCGTSQVKTENIAKIPHNNPCPTSTIGKEDSLLSAKQSPIKHEYKNCSTHFGLEEKKSEYRVGSESTLKDPVWCDVGIFKGTSCLVTSYYVPSSKDPDHPTIASDNLPDFNNSLKIYLEPGTAYKFRICAINSCGRGHWSEVSAFRTSLPGYPGAPSSVSISRSIEGAHLSWQPPSNPAGNIIEYTVCLAVKNSSQVHGEHTRQKLTLMKVYSGPRTQTVVSNVRLAEALIDTTSKPAIIFRIAAKNEKGFGPPTQVRWLQELTDSKV